MQHRGLSKLLGLSYKIEYKKGVENKVADALSRREGQNGPIENEGAELNMVSELIPQWVEDIKKSYEGDRWIEGLQEKLKSSKDGDHSHHLSDHLGVLRYKGRVCVGNQSSWRQQILGELHDSALGGHSGVTATYQRVKRNFYWPQMKESVHQFVQHCTNCQLNKTEHVSSPGLLHPLPKIGRASGRERVSFIV